jgi:amino acid adenylation domain-containing protein
MLAIARLGAAYVPMDPAYPAERLQFTAQDAGLRLVVVGEDGFPGAAGVRCVTPEDLSDAVGEAVTADVADAASPEAVAYVIYTSGSTGRPKGVAIPHRNVAALIGATRESMALGPQDVWTFFHSAAFDFSVVVPYWVSRDPDAFHALLAEKGVTVLNQTPSAFYALKEADARSAPMRRLRLVIFGGEALNTRALVDWYRRYPSPICRTINMFGITETTVHVTIRDITPALALAGSRTVGGPLPGWSVSVRNAAGEVQPLGVPGEIYVGGAGLAQEYLNRPDLSQERFVLDPLTGARQYRSGDLGRMHPDGALDHLGRIDSQVKVRGFRIELDEVRAVLQAVEGVRAAAVVVAEALEGDGATAQLDAYVVLEDWMRPERLRKEIAEILPAYMMPARIVPVEKLALTVNGKLDVKSMRANVEPTAAQPAPEAATAAAGPSDALSAMLSIWQGCFTDPVKPSDDFFQIGGNSITAVKLKSEICKALGVGLSLRDLFLNPTPERLVDHLSRQAASQ